MYALKKAGHSQKEIARLLGRSPSTISRRAEAQQRIAGIQAKASPKIVRCSA
ncbi:MAG: helix-turn-helix domain-containing protein [Candidatus Thiodiazotropha sp. (ex Gloverina cf. vestifex)]|nr:helix-turn-helix domain-containing protein [Candidatus Thiodiazotropha sp. (ex Gloverina cf. vestifex)]